MSEIWCVIEKEKLGHVAARAVERQKIKWK